MLVLFAGVSLALPALASPAAPAGARPHSLSTTDTSKAKAINIKDSDMPSSTKWASTPQTPYNKAETAAGKKAIACIDKSGAVSGDAFGTSRITGGEVVVDVRSDQYYEASATLTELPAANSEVVFLSSAGDATKDLNAFERKSSLSCLGAQLVVESEAEGSGSVKISANVMPAPHYGGGNGGLRIRFVETGGLLPGGLYNDEYFYVQGPSEVSFSFLNLGTPFSTSWADSIIEKVMKRAASTVGAS